VAAPKNKVYSFKSVGELNSDVLQQSFNTLRITPMGIKTPMSFDKGPAGTLFSMNYNVATQIRDNLKNLLLTNKGERLMLADFGADLRPLATELTNEDVTNEALRRISQAVSKYMPFIELETFETRTQESQNGLTVGIVVKVTYSVPTINVTNQVIETVIYVVG